MRGLNFYTTCTHSARQLGLLWAKPGGAKLARDFIYSRRRNPVLKMMRSTFILCTGLLGLVLIVGSCHPAEKAGSRSEKTGPPPVETMTAQELQAQLAAAVPPLVLDVRTPAEFASGHVPGARNIPFDEVPGRLDELEGFREGTVVLYCQSGHRAGIATATLQGAGFTHLAHLAGDMPGWAASGLPVEK